MTEFALHPTLAADSYLLGQVGAVQVRMHRSAQFPWFLLVPEDPATELHELPPALRAELQALADRVGRFVLKHWRCDKLNIAAIGNVVPQLHLHVIGRRQDDALWPRVVWGNLQEGPLRDEADAAAIAAELRRAQVLR